MVFGLFRKFTQKAIIKGFDAELFLAQQCGLNEQREMIEFLVEVIKTGPDLPLPKQKQLFDSLQQAKEGAERAYGMRDPKYLKAALAASGLTVMLAGTDDDKKRIAQTAMTWARTLEKQTVQSSPAQGKEEFQKDMREAMQASCEGGIDADTFPNGNGRFGFDQGNPIPCNTIFGANAYLDGLRTLDGGSIKYERLGSMASAVTPMPVDAYRIFDSNRRDLGVLYISPYQKRNSQKVPEGFRAKFATSPEAVAPVIVEVRPSTDDQSVNLADAIKNANAAMDRKLATLGDEDSTIAKRLRKLQELYDEDLITDEEYEDRKSQILDEI